MAASRVDEDLSPLKLGADNRPAIEARDLRKRFGDFEAVRGVSFDVMPGETFGFLGPNGAGKSTTISMLCTLLKPSGGSALVAGHDVVAGRAEVRRRIGLVFQDTTLDDYLTAARTSGSMRSSTACPSASRDSGCSRCSRWSASGTAATASPAPSPAE